MDSLSMNYLLNRQKRKIVIICFYYHTDKNFLAVKQRSPSPASRGGLTISGAKYASEDCATLVHYTIAIVEYTRLCGPLKSALERVHELEREIEENERLRQQQEEEVGLCGIY